MTPPKKKRFKRRGLPLHWQIILGMVLGIGLGLALVSFAGDAGKDWIVQWVKPFGTLFINLLKMIAVPLIVASLVKGLADLKDISKLSAMGARTLSFYIFTTALAVSIGLLMVNLFEPGNSIEEATRNQLLEQFGGDMEATLSAAAESKKSPLQMMVDLVPDNVFWAMADNGRMLQVILFVLFFGVSLILIPPVKSAPVVAFFDGLNEVILKMIDLVMKTAPLGVFALMSAMVAEAPSMDLFKALGFYALVVVLGLFTLIFIDALIVWLFAGRSPLSFLRAIAPAQLLAFSTSSSAATLPVTMDCVRENIGVDEEVASFCLPVGATINMDGTSLYQAVAAVFIAQVFGQDLSMGQQLSIILTATLASIGSAAVPGAGMLMLVVVLESVGLRPEGIALIVAIDRPLDMLRTVSNVTGDSMVATVVAKSLGKLRDPNQDAEDFGDESQSELPLDS